MTWAEICEDKRLQNLPFRIESDRWGHIIMSPPPRSRHGEYQFEIGARLRELLPNGRVITECPIQTSEGVKAPDVAWVSLDRRASRQNDPCYLISPEICVEVLSPSNSPEEMSERKLLFFQAGALEFWLCDEFGRMDFWVPSGLISKSQLCPAFPFRIEI